MLPEFSLNKDKSTVKNDGCPINRNPKVGDKVFYAFKFLNAFPINKSNIENDNDKFADDYDEGESDGD